MAGYGIGRVPRDVDPTDETRANIEAAEIMGKLTTPTPRPANRVRLRCRRCGDTGFSGEYPFTTYGHTFGDRPICDDCG